MSLKFFCHALKRRQEIDYDAVVAITGEEGVSKTTGSIQISKKIDRNFDMEKSMIYSTNVNELQEKVLNPHIKVINVDEAIKLLYKLNFQSKQQKFLNQLYTLCRQENKITTLCIPRFRDLNEYFRNHRVKFWIHIIDRGVGIVFVRDWSPFAKDPWWMDENQKIIDKESYMKKIIEFDVKAKMKILARSKNFLTIITYEDLSDEEKEIYKNIVGNNKYTGITHEEEKKLSAREQHYYDILQRMAIELFNKGISRYKIGKQLGMNKETVTVMLEKAGVGVTTEESEKDVLNVTPQQQKQNFLRKIT